MKILRAGNADVLKFPYDTHLRCGYCHCEFQLELGDDWDKITHSPYPDDFDEDRLSVQCPHCGRQIVQDGPPNPQSWADVPAKPERPEPDLALLTGTGA